MLIPTIIIAFFAVALEPAFIRDFIECGWQHTLDGKIEVWWQFKAQQKLVKSYE